jgi:PAS domain S-box-containing protein
MADLLSEELTAPRRLAALRALQIMDTEPDPALDRLVALARRLFGCEIAMITFLDANRCWAKAAIGWTGRQTDRAASLCQATLEGDGLLVVPDTAKDDRFADAAYVAGDPSVRFYAGAAITTDDGLRLGVICVLGRSPRAGLSEDERATLTDLAGIVMAQLERRRQTRLASLGGPRIPTETFLGRIAVARNCDDAISGVLSNAAAVLGAHSCRLWKMVAPELGLRELACSSPSGAMTVPAPLDQVPSWETALTLQATLDGTARCVRSTEIAGSGDPLAAIMRAEGTVCAIIQPTIIGESRYAMILTFRWDREDLEGAADNLTSLLASLAPALHRKDVSGRLRLLTEALDAAGDGVLITEADPQNPVIVYSNDGFTRLTGFSSADLVGRSLQHLQQQEAFGPVLRPLLDPLVNHGLEAAVTQRSVTIPFGRDGAPIWVEIDVTPITDGAGTVTHCISILRDISIRKAAEREARERDASFRLMFEDNPLPMVIYDPANFDIAEVNAAAVESYGFARAQFIQMKLLDLIPEEDYAAAEAFVAQLDGGAANSAWTHLRASGERTRVQAFGHALTFAGKRTRLAVFWDSTEIEQARDALRQSNQELLVLAAQLQARTTDLTEVNRRARLGMWRVPPDGSPGEWSDEMFEIFGRPVQRPGPDFATALGWVAEADRARVREIVTRAAERRTTSSFEFRAVRSDGTIRHCLADLRPEYGYGHRLVALKGFCQDITERKETELALLRSEKLKTIGQFTGGVAHDFNNLLTVMMLNIEEVIDSLEPDHPMQSLLAPVLHAAMRGSELTSHLLSYARRSPLEPMHVSLNDLFDGLNPLLTRILGDRFTLDVRHRDGVLQPFADAAKLENAVLNLVINARDAMASGGTITISTSVARLDAMDAGSWNEFVPGDYAVISVADTGCGIPADLFPRVFEPFFTTKTAGKGSGLGLSMVYGFAKQSGGHVTIVSEVGVGTTATLYLPLHGGDDPAVRDPKPLAKGVAPQMTALLVEDQPEVLETVKRQLLALGFQVIVAADAARAMEHLTASGMFDLLFSDVSIPGPIDGAQLAAIARERHPHIRILLTSGYVEHTAALTTDLALGTEFLQKPYSRADLSARLAAMFPAS